MDSLMILIYCHHCLTTKIVTAWEAIVLKLMTPCSYRKSIERMYNLHAYPEEFTNDDNHSFTFSDTDEFLQEQNDLCNGATCGCRRRNRFGYSFSNIYKSNYYLHSLHQSVRERTYLESQDRYSVFRSFFQMPL